MFEPFPIPDNIERELIAFFKSQQAFPLNVINSRLKSEPSVTYRHELSKHYGVYIIYYTGSHHMYSDLSERNRVESIKPIYVGKAVSTGSRIGQSGKFQAPALGSSEEDGGTTIEDAKLILSPNASEKLDNHLFKRLNEHANNIKKTNTLDVDDFQVRVIPMAAAMVQWAEAVMINRLKPVWNAQISGFGNHDPGKGRYEQARSIWDQIHPGRPWAEKLKNLTAYDEQHLKRYIRLTLDINLE